MNSRIGHLHITVRAPNGADAVSASEALEESVRDVLLALEQEFRDEVLFLRELDIPLRALRRGDARVDWRAHLDEIVRREIRRVRLRLRTKAGTTEAIVEDGAAWFVSEGAYLAEAMLSERGATAEWVFAELRAHDLVVALERASPLVLSDALAMVAARSAPRSQSAQAHPDFVGWIDRVAARLGRLDPERLLTALLPVSGGHPVGERVWATPLDAQIAQLPAQARAILVVLRSSTVPVRRLAALAVLFASWPAARALVTSQPTGDVGSRAETSSFLRTDALMLLVVADHAQETLSMIGFEYAEQNGRAARWAVGRALAQTRVSPYDPLVLLFAGEDPVARPAEAVFRELDSEPLHACAVRAAASLHDGALRVWRAGDRLYVLAGEICVDYLEVSDADSISEVVRRFTARAGAPPREVRPVEEPPMRDIDLVLTADLPILPDRWRAAVLAFVTTVRAQLHAGGVDLERIAATSAGLRRTAPGRFHLVASGTTRSLLTDRLAFPVRLGRFSIELEP